jgi:hypothetical protein
MPTVAVNEQAGTTMDLETVRSMLSTVAFSLFSFTESLFTFLGDHSCAAQAMQ